MQIRIDTEHTREIGRRLITEADRMAEIGRELQNAIGSLDTGAWDGRSRARAEPLLGRVRPERAHLAEGLDALGRKLVRVAEVFEQKDHTAARELEDLPWVEFDVGAGVAGSGVAAVGAVGAVVGTVGGGAAAAVGDAAGSEAISDASGSLASGFDVRDWAKERVEGDVDFGLIGRERVLWPERRGRPKKYHPSVELDVALLEGQVWKGEETDHTRLGGVRLGGKADAEAIKGEAGVGLGWDEKGLIAGGFAAGTLFTAGASGVIGSTDLGLAGGMDVTAGEAEAFLGYRDGQAGAKIGGTLVSAEGTVGANVAGWNVGLTGEIGVKFELGFSIGKRTKVYLGPFTIGLNIGEALGS